MKNKKIKKIVIGILWTFLAIQTVLPYSMVYWNDTNTTTVTVKWTNPQLAKEYTKFKNLIDTKLEWLLDKALYNKIANKTFAEQLKILKNIKQSLLSKEIENNKTIQSYTKEDKKRLILFIKKYLITKIIVSLNNKIQLFTLLWPAITPPVAVTKPVQPVKPAQTAKKIVSIENEYEKSVPTSNNVILQKITFNLPDDVKQLSLTEVNLKLKGLIEKNSIKDVYLLDKNYMVIWYEKSFNTNYEANFTFGSYIKNDIIDKDNNVIYLAVNIVPNSVNWTFQISWNIKTDSTNEKLKNIAIQSNNLKMVSYTPQTTLIQWYNETTNIFVWKTAKIWQFSLTVWNWNSSKNIVLDTIILNNNWSDLKKNLENIVLKDSDWKVVATAYKIIKDKIAMKFNPNYIIKNWETKIFTIEWKVVDWSNDFIQFNIENPRDIIWYEAGDSEKVYITSQILWTNTFWKYEIKSWKITISKDKTSSNDVNIPIWISSEILRFDIFTPQDLTLNGFNPVMTINNDSWKTIETNKIFSNISLLSCNSDYTTCSSVWTFDLADTSLTNWETKDITLKWYLSTIKQWNNHYMIKINTLPNCPEKVNFKIGISNKAFDSLENSNWNNIELDNMNWNVETSYKTLVNPNMQITYNNPYWTLDAIKGWKDISFWDFVFLPNISNIKLNDLKMKIIETTANTTSDANNTTDFSDIQAKLYKDWKLVQIKNVNKDWTVDFNTNTLLNKDTVSKLEVKIDTTNALYNGTELKKFKLEIENPSDITLLSKAWTLLSSNNIIWTFPLDSEELTVYPSAKLYFTNTNNIIWTQILYWQNENLNNVFNFNIKPKYDNTKIQDLYIWLYNLDNTLATWNNTVSQIEYNWNIQKTVPVVNWLASFLDLKDVLSKWAAKTLAFNVKTNDITSISQDNKEYKLWLYSPSSTSDLKKNKFISLSNWEVIEEPNIVWNIWKWNPFIIRKSMINMTSNMSSYSNEVVANNTNYTLYELKISNNNNNQNKIKQFTLKVNVSNVDTWADISMKDFKFKISSNWTDWSDVTDKVEYQIVKAWDDFDWSKYWTDWSITESWSNTYYISARFTWDYKQWYLMSNNLYIKVEWTLDGFWKNDSVSFWLEEYNWDNNNWTMKKYDDFASWKWPYNAIIWSDNIVSDWTSLSDANWFEDYKTINDNSRTNILYKN